MANVNNWCTLADEIIEAEAGTLITNARTTNAIVAIAVQIVDKLQKNAEARRYVDSESKTYEQIPIMDRDLRRQIAKCFEPDGIPFGSFKLVKDRND